MIPFKMMFAEKFSPPQAENFIYYRLFITAVQSGTFFQMAEVELLDESNVNILTPSTETDQSSFYSGVTYDASKLVDGSSSTKWTSDGASSGPEWVSFKVASDSPAVARIAITAYSASEAARQPKDFKLQVSTNGTTWSDVISFTGQTNWTNYERRILSLLPEIVYPTTDDVTVSGNEDSAIGFTLSGGTVVNSFKIKSIPVTGTLFNGATVLAVGSEIAATANSANITFQPTSGYSGSASFTYSAVSDTGVEDLTPATVSITVNPIYYPVSADSSFSLPQNTSTTFSISGSIAAGTISGFNVTDLPDQGTVTYQDSPVSVGSFIPAVSNVAALSYSPSSGSFVGSDSFSFAAVADTGRVDPTPATVSITVTEVRPVAIPIGINLGQDTETTFELQATISSGTVSTITVVTLPSNGKLFNGNNELVANSVIPAVANKLELRYVPTIGWYGADQFTFTATSALGRTDLTPAAATITVVADSAEVWMSASSMVNNSSDLTVSTNYWLPS